MSEWTTDEDVSSDADDEPSLACENVKNGEDTDEDGAKYRPAIGDCNAESQQDCDVSHLPPDLQIRIRHSLRAHQRQVKSVNKPINHCHLQFMVELNKVR